MDFSKYDARAAAEIARPLHIKGLDGVLLEDGGKPCRVWVKGSASHSVQDAIRAAMRNQMKVKDDDARTLEDLHDDIVRAAARMVTGFENIHRGEVLAKAPDDVEWFLNLTFYSLAKDEKGKPMRLSFAQQVVEFGTDDPGFLASVLKS